MTCVRICLDDNPDLVQKADMLVMLCYETARDLVLSQEGEDILIEELRNPDGRTLLKITRRVLDEESVYICVDFYSEELYHALLCSKHLHDVKDVLNFYVLGLREEDTLKKLAEVLSTSDRCACSQ